MKGGLWLLHIKTDFHQIWGQKVAVTVVYNVHSGLFTSFLGTTLKLNVWSWTFGFISPLKMSIWDTKCNFMSHGIQENRLSSRELLIVKVVRMQPFVGRRERVFPTTSIWPQLENNSNKVALKTLCGSFQSDLILIVIWKAHWRFQLTEQVSTSDL